MSLMLITGASRGLGREFAYLHAQKKGDLILISRNESQLNALKQELEELYGVLVYVISMDLGIEGAAFKIYAGIKALGLEPELVVNNAGIGCKGTLDSMTPVELERLITLNVTTLTMLCRLFVADMKKRGRGRILNISSIVSLLPGPYMAPYYASKAFVTSLSDALWQECRGSGVSVTALLPGPMNTGFVKASKLAGSNVSVLFTATPRKVAIKGYTAMLKGKRRLLAGLGPITLLMWLIPLLPKRLVLMIVAKMQRQ